jgi:serine/threonine protein phosphatase 1
MKAWLNAKNASPVSPSVPEGQILYAIGDLHGMTTLTQCILVKVLNDAKRFSGDRARVIFLGDYVDKGDNAKTTLDLLIEAEHNTDVDWTFIKGNHEDALLTFLNDPEFGPQWLSYGGGPTLHAYGLTPPTDRNDPDAWHRLAEQLSHEMPSEHHRFLSRLVTSFEAGSYFFVHAGIRPGRSLKDQEDGDLMWIRRQFLDDKSKLPAIIVHGHSPDLKPYRDSRRIGIDTGAYATGCLTAVRLKGSAVDMISVSRQTSDMTVEKSV